MRVMITGGTGLIGTALVDSLIKDGHEVLVLTRDPERQSGKAHVTFIAWDGKTASGWGHWVNEVDVIVNLAGENLSTGRWTPARKASILNSRVHAGGALVQALQQAHKLPGVLVQASGVGCYGVENPALLDENSPPGKDYLAQVSKEWEASTQMIEGLGIRRVIIRSGVVLSKNGGALRLMLLPFRLFAGGPLGNGRQWISWVHIEDEVRAIRFLIDNKAARGTFNISAQPVSNNQFAQTAARVLHRPGFFKVPAFLLRLVLGEMSTMVLDGQQVTSKKLTDLGFEYKYKEIESALRELTQPSA